jgi:hypothetical protein
LPPAAASGATERGSGPRTPCRGGPSPC